MLKLYKYTNLSYLFFRKLLLEDLEFNNSRLDKFKYYKQILTTFRFNVINKLEFYFNIGISKNFTKIFVNNLNFFLTIILMLKYSLLFSYNYLIDITCIDLLNINFDNKKNLNLKQINYEKNRFALIYIFNNIKKNSRICIQIFINKHQIVPSLSKLFLGSNWLEREIFDLFGIFFSNHIDLRRILTDYGFKHNPLLKDFPLTGYLELKYDEKIKAINYVPVKLMQEFKDFNFNNPWTHFFNTNSLFQN